MLKQLFIFALVRVARAMRQNCCAKHCRVKRFLYPQRPLGFFECIRDTGGRCVIFSTCVLQFECSWTSNTCSLSKFFFYNKNNLYIQLSSRSFNSLFLMHGKPLISILFFSSFFPLKNHAIVRGNCKNPNINLR